MIWKKLTNNPKFNMRLIQGGGDSFCNGKGLRNKPSLFYRQGFKVKTFAEKCPFQKIIGEMK